MENVKKFTKLDIQLSSSKEEAAKDADALIIATEWKEFRQIDLSNLGSILKEKVVFDGRNIYSLKDMAENNFHYISMGRKIVK